MRFMILLKADADSEAGVLPDEAMLTAMTKYNEELVAAGVMRAGEGLQASAQGARIHFSGSQRTVKKGPFGPPEQLLAGFWIFEVASLDEAISWVKRCPNPHHGEAEIEIRRIFEAEDFDESLTPELREKEARMRAQIEGKG
jgi:hypothetical protein